MAMFHFRLKSDKKPDGTKISAVKHVEYIRREGNFADIEQFRKKINKFSGNFISPAETKNITENSSLTTISIALMLADETMNHKPLNISGSANFKKSVIQSALLANLSVSFTDKILQNEFIHQKEILENDRKKFVADGGTLISNRPNHQSRVAPTHAQTVESATKIGLRLPTLSQLNVVHSESNGADLLLPNDESRELEQLAKNSYNAVRWNFSNERKKLARQTAEKILQRVEETMDYVFAASHVEYINREKAFARRGGCIFHSHKLPKWAKNDPKKFFKAADKYESKDNRRYREIEFALPNELKTVEQYRQIIDTFIEKHLKNHYFAYAIHDKIGAMSNGQHHPHVHIMFSERMIDDVEKIKERAACNFFKYPARKKKDGSEPTFEEKLKHGAPKNRNWADKSFLSVLRADFAQIQNEVLEKNGFSIRVDHRTLKAQKEDAERNGDTFLARLFNRIPEKYIGVISCKEEENSQLERLKEFRTLRKRHFDLIFKIDSLMKESEELETKDAVQLSSIKAKNFIHSQEFLSQKFDSERLKNMKSKMFSAVAEVNKWKRVIISNHDAEEQAKLEYMTESERELWQKYFETVAQKQQLEDFLKTLRKPDALQKDALQAYNDVVSGVKKKIFTLMSAAILMKKSVEEIEKKLETPDFKKNILMVAHQILQANVHARKMLKLASDNLDRSVDELKNAIFAQTVGEEKQNIFKTREVYDLIRRQFFGLKKEYEKTLDKKFELQNKIISPQRAVEMAKNIFVHGGFKKLRTDLRKLKKDEQKFALHLSEFKNREKIFLNRDWYVEERNLFVQEKYSLTREKTLLELEQHRLTDLKISLTNRQTELDSLCQKPDSLKKIELIAAGILRKNYKFVRQFEEIESCCKNLSQRVEHAKEQMEILKRHLSTGKQNFYYKVNSSQNLQNNSAASLIADAILRESQAAQLVARSAENSLEMDKTWELMSELDKDEILQKKILREL